MALRASTESDPVSEAALKHMVIEHERCKQAKGRWPGGFKRRAGKPYQLRSRTVMDTSDPEISREAHSAWEAVGRLARRVAR